MADAERLFNFSSSIAAWIALALSVWVYFRDRKEKETELRVEVLTAQCSGRKLGIPESHLDLKIGLRITNLSSNPNVVTDATIFLNDHEVVSGPVWPLFGEQNWPLKLGQKDTEELTVGTMLMAKAHPELHHLFRSDKLEARVVLRDQYKRVCEVTKTVQLVWV